MKIGSRVEIIDNGRIYDAYESFYNTYKNNFTHPFGGVASNGQRGYINTIKNHLSTDKQLAIVNLDNGESVIIDLEGLVEKEGLHTYRSKERVVVIKKNRQCLSGFSEKVFEEVGTGSFKYGLGGTVEDGDKGILDKIYSEDGNEYALVLIERTGKYAVIELEGLMPLRPNFKVGDIVKGVKFIYGITNERMTRGEIVRIREDIVDIRVLEHMDDREIGIIFQAHKGFFELAEEVKKMNKFQVGDIVRGIRGNGYSVTNEDTKEALVVSVESHEMRIKVLKHEYECNEGFMANVHMEKFELVERGTEENLIERLGSKDIKHISVNCEENRVERMKMEVDSAEKEVIKKRRELASAVKALETYRRGYLKELSIKNKGEELIAKVKEQLRLIGDDEKVDSIKVVDDRIIILTKQLYAQGVGIYEEGIFKLNRYRIEMKPKINEVKIFGIDEGYNRKSCWTDNDPHPHVSGRNGEPCWGNTQTMLCDTMSRDEFYMTYLMVLNFLESYNLDDVAGRNIRNWDFVDENGDELELPPVSICKICDTEIEDEDDEYECDHCGGVVCSDCYYWSDYHEERICEDCANEYYEYIEGDFVKSELTTVCDFCDKRIITEDAVAIGDRYYCDDECVENDEYERCVHCDEWYERADMIYIDDEYYCSDDCACDAGYFMCEECGIWEDNGNMYENDGRELCENCYENEKSDEEEEANA